MPEPEPNTDTVEMQESAATAGKQVTRSLRLGWKWVLRRSWHWFYGLLGSVIGSMANAITVMIIDPSSFNMNEGWKKLTTFMGVSALVSAGLYLKQSPLPTFDEDSEGVGLKKKKH